jgi:enamine deaminase RidA (YjgF/YER057c/UK114 family)
METGPLQKVTLMADKIATRLRELGIILPPVPTPSANFLPFIVDGDRVQLSGTISKLTTGEAVTGKLGRDVTLEQGRHGARLCALNLLAALNEALAGDLDRVRGIMMVRGFVNAADGFVAMPQVINGASDLLVEVFGPERGRHARTAIGCASLPSNAAVEVDALVLV